jgi:hypothetical protein
MVHQQRKSAEMNESIAQASLQLCVVSDSNREHCEQGGGGDGIPPPHR